MAETFGRLLRRYRQARTVTRMVPARIETVPLSQNELAIRAGLTPGAVNRLESGCNPRPQRETVERLAEGMRLSAVETDLLLASAGYLPALLAALAEEDLVQVLADVAARRQRDREAVAGG